MLCAELLVPDGQLSRMRSVDLVACPDEWLGAVDLHERPFGCFMLMPVDAAGSPGRLPRSAVTLSALCRVCGCGVGWCSCIGGRP